MLWTADPYVWFFAACALAGIFLMRWCKRANWRAFWFNIAVLALALGVCEFYFFYRMTNGGAVSMSSPGLVEPDDVLGVAPAKGVAKKSELKHRGAVVYDVTYTIGADGLRVSPPAIPMAPDVVFFGCSFTFGYGVNDDQALPFRAGVLSNGKYHVRNFGFSGYGAQQMLSALDHGLVDEALDSQPTHFIYQAIPDHIQRATGMYTNQAGDPRFVLLDDGSLIQKGRVGDSESGTPHSRLYTALKIQLEKSYLLRRVTSRVRPVGGRDVRLWLEIVKKSRRIVKSQFPGAQFHVILWEWVNSPSPEQEVIHKQMAEGLREAGMPVHLVGNILPGYDRDPAPYQIKPLIDSHPNARAHDLLAQYVVREILENGSEK